MPKAASWWTNPLLRRRLMSESDIESRLQEIGKELLSLASESGCNIVGVRVQMDRGYVNGYAFSDDSQIASVIDWSIDEG